MELKFRLGTMGDIKEIETLIMNAIAAMQKEQIDQWDERYPDQEILKEDIGKKQLYVGCLEDRIAVIYVLNNEFDKEYDIGAWRHKDKPFCVLHRLCVNPKNQKQGIARATILHIEKELMAKGITAIRLDVFSKNPHALHLYDSLGFSKVGHADWRKGRFYLMEKYISMGDEESMTLRELSIKEIDKIKPFFAEVFMEEPWNDDWSDEVQLHAYMIDLIGNANSLVLAMMEKEKMVGLSIGSIRHWCIGTEYYIDEFCIKREEQGKGYGTQFLKLIESYIKPKGMTGIFLQTEHAMPAYKFYKKNGFCDLEEHVSLYKDISE